MGGLNFMLYKFWEFNNPASEESGVAFWKPARTVDDPDQISKDIQVLDMATLFRWQCYGTGT